MIYENIARYRRVALSLVAFPAMLCGGFCRPSFSAPAGAPVEVRPESAGMETPAWRQASQRESKAPVSPNASAPTSPDESLMTLRAAVNEVHLVFFVTDKHGHYVRDLTQQDFEIRDDHQPPQQILSFRSETDLPLEVGLLIDTSQSVRDRFQFEKEAASDFLKQILRPGYDHAFVMGFDQSPKVTQDFSDNAEKLAVGIRKLQPGNLTAMYDAIQYACREKLLKQPQERAVRRILVLLSDGDDNASSATLQRTIDAAQQAEVSVFAISTSLVRSGGPGYKNLKSLAEASGGRSYVPIRIAEVADAFAAVQENLRSQYSVSYRAAHFMANGHYRSIEIEVKGRRGLHVHCRKGYRGLAPGQAASQGMDGLKSVPRSSQPVSANWFDNAGFERLASVVHF
jgi:Ca-activated chloride channel homolog